MSLYGMQFISENKFNEGIMILAIGLRTHEYDQQGKLALLMPVIGII